MLVHLSTNQILAKEVEIFSDAVSRARGWLKYPLAPEHKAGVFVLPFNGILPIAHTFGMKFNIDILYCNQDKKIIDAFYKVAPSKIVVPWKNIFLGAAYMIEVPAGAASFCKAGDQLQWEAA